MKIDLGKTLAGLKHSLQTAMDLSRPWDRFHDEVAMFPIFSIIGQVEDNPRVVWALETGAAHLLKQRRKAVHANFVHLAEHRFWHGHCQIGPRTVIFFFFDDIDIGLAGYFKDVTAPEVDLVRLTVLEVQQGRAQAN